MCFTVAYLCSVDNDAFRAFHAALQLHCLIFDESGIIKPFTHG